jgi:hypothetical protein
MVDEKYDFVLSFIHQSGTAQDQNFVGKPEDLYLWRYSG